MNALELNFYADWIEFLRHQLTEYGDPPKPGTSDEKVEFLYFNVVKRAIQPRPRRVNLPDGFKPPVDLDVDFEKFIADGAPPNKRLQQTSADAHLYRLPLALAAEAQYVRRLVTP